MLGCLGTFHVFSGVRVFVHAYLRVHACARLLMNRSTRAMIGPRVPVGTGKTARSRVGWLLLSLVMLRCLGSLPTLP
jgi:hypothetical protein